MQTALDRGVQGSRYQKSFSEPKPQNSEDRVYFGQDRTKILDLLAELKECSQTRNLQRGKQVHAEAIECGLHSNLYVASALTHMYAKCSSMVDAHQVFSTMKHPNVVSWNVIILGYAENGQALTALDLFTEMEILPDSVTFVAALKACISVASTGRAKGWEECRQWGSILHVLAVENVCDLDIFVQSTLVDMYAKCGSMVDARQVFNSMSQRRVVSWNALLLGYAQIGKAPTAMDLLRTMRREGIAPDSTTFVAVLKACSCLVEKECRERSKIIHSLVVEDACDSNIYVQNTLIGMYAKGGSMQDARQVFDSMNQRSVVSWTVLILGYADNNEELTALRIFAWMRSEGFTPDPVTFVAALKACTSFATKEGASGWLECGEGIHNLALEKGCDSDIYVQSILIDMYAKCGKVMSSRREFDTMKHPNVVAWCSLILGYAENGQAVTAVELFRRMKTTGLSPDSVASMAALKACGLVGGLELGRTIHSELEMQQRDIDLDVVLVNCLVDFYVKCGSLQEARSVFDRHARSRNIVTWTSLLAGFSSCGDHHTVFELFRGIQDAGLLPNSVTLLCVLACCSHAGLVEKGSQCFSTMFTKYRIAPTVEHYTCMIDVLGRANKLDDAMAWLEQMPCSADHVTWMSVLGSCRRRRNMEVGRLAFQCLVNLTSLDSAPYVLMGQIYGCRGMWQEQQLVMGMCSRSAPSPQTADEYEGFIKV